MYPLCQLALSLLLAPAPAWGFYAHQKINQYAVFLLPPEMMVFYKPHIGFITEHAVDPDKRRYMIPEEGPRHYLDIDHYGAYPYDSLPRKWEDAQAKFGDSLAAHGIVPWWILTMKGRLTKAFREKDAARILKLSAELGHYIADAHVPLHTSSNHNGQLTGQKGIHGFWESRIPELLAEKEWDFVIGRAFYIQNPSAFTWSRLLQSAAASDTVLRFERALTEKFPADAKYAFEYRNGILVRQYSEGFTRAYDRSMNGMVERRMRAAIEAIASFWYTCWIDAGQPDLKALINLTSNPDSEAEFERLNQAWRKGSMLGRQE